MGFGKFPSFCTSEILPMSLIPDWCVCLSCRCEYDESLMSPHESIDKFSQSAHSWKMAPKLDKFPSFCTRLYLSKRLAGKVDGIVDGGELSSVIFVQKVPCDNLCSLIIQEARAP